ncbi:MAG TPA: glycosyl hydrolase, partial [Acidimicrobiales bacterium]|nr:glycosyl hydrolase [Acidimicrobiales bacterium]
MLATLAMGLSLAAISGAAESPSSVIGVYAGMGNPSGIAAVNSLVGYKVRYAMDFLNASSWATISNPSHELSKWSGTGYQMTWSVPILPTGHSSSEGTAADGTSLVTGATGAYDTYFQKLATSLVAAGQGSSIIRLGWEFNNASMPWAADGHVSAFLSYWQQIVDSMRSVSGANFRFEWCPDRGDLGVGNLADYYPGDAYVNLVGLDVFDEASGSYPGPQAEWQNILTESYGLNWLTSFAATNNEPVALPEWGLGSTSGGTVGGGDDPYFVQQTAQWISQNNVSNVIAWDTGSNPLPSPSDPLSQAAFAAAFALSGGTTTSTTDPPTTTTQPPTTTTDPPTTTTQPPTTTTDPPTTTTQPPTTTTTNPPTTTTQPPT